jgi:hypothetical protein
MKEKKRARKEVRTTIGNIAFPKLGGLGCLYLIKGKECGRYYVAGIFALARLGAA